MHDWSTGEDWICETFCDSWACPCCGRRNKSKWVGNFTEKLPDVVFAALIAVDEQRLREIKKRLSDDGENFLSIRTADNQTLIVATSLFADDWNCVEVPKAEALEMIAARIDHLLMWPDPPRKPVSTSKAWANKKPEPGNSTVAGPAFASCKESELIDHLRNERSTDFARRPTRGGRSSLSYRAPIDPAIARDIPGESAMARIVRRRKGHDFLDGYYVQVNYLIRNSIDGVCIDNYLYSPEAEQLITGRATMSPENAHSDMLTCKT